MASAGEQARAAALLARHDVLALRAGNPGPFTLEGTNSWVVGRDPAWVVDPGPGLAEHLDALVGAVAARGGLGGIALTHSHPDHAEAAPLLRERAGADAPVAAAAGGAGPYRFAGPAPTLPLAGGDRAGPLTAVATPGHAPDHLAFALGALVFSGDAVLGRGSSLLIPAPGALARQLESIERMRALRPALICPGHGPPLADPETALAAYRAHRLERERRLLDALARGLRTADELLDDAWADAPAALRGAATVTLAAHLDKLADEGRLPAGVERPALPERLGRVRGQAP